MDFIRFSYPQKITKFCIPGSLHVCSGAIEKDNIYTNTVCVLSLISGYHLDKLLSIHIKTTTTHKFCGILYNILCYCMGFKFCEVQNFVDLCYPHNITAISKLVIRLYAIEI